MTKDNNTDNGFKIASVHLLGAAVDNEVSEKFINPFIYILGYMIHLM
jgi:hypothetical protein